MRQIVSNMRFLVMWMLGSAFVLVGGTISTVIISVGAGMVAAILWTSRNLEPSRLEVLFFSLIVYSLVGAVLGLMNGLVQRGILAVKTGYGWAGWVISSILGGIVGINVALLLLSQHVTTHITMAKLPPKETLFVIALELIVIPLACISIAQMFILWRYVRAAWLWVLANVVAGIVVVSLGVSLLTGALTLVALGAAAVMLLAPGVVTGFSMLWLLLFHRK